MTRHRLKFISLVIALLLAGLLASYALAGFLLLPWLAHRYVPQYLEERLGRSVSVASVHVQPFLLQLEVRGLAVEGHHGRPVVALERLQADLALAGLFRRAWTFDDLRLDGLRVHLVMTRDGNLNVQEIANQLEGEDSAPGKAAPAFVIHSLSVPDASVVFTDLSGAAPASARIDAVTLEAEGITTAEQGRGRHRLTANLPAGGTLQWTGELGLQPSLNAEGEVQVRGLKAKTIWPFLRDELRLSEVQASSVLAGHYSYDAEQSLRLSSVTAEISDLALKGVDSADRLLSLETVVASGGSLDLSRRAVNVAEIALRNGHAHMAIAPDGSINWPGLLAGDEEERPGIAESDGVSNRGSPVATGDVGSGWSVTVEAVRLADVGVTAVDKSRQQPLELEIAQVNAQMKLLVALQGATQVVAEGISGSVKQASASAIGAESAPIRITSAVLQNGRFDLQARQFGAQRVAVEGGRAALRRQSDGSVPLLELLAGPAAPPGADTGQPWRYAMDSVGIASFDLRLEDQRTRPPLALDAVLQASATPVAVGQPARFEASLVLTQGGAINASGSAAPGATSVQAQVALNGVALVPLQPLLAKYAALSLQSGAVSGSLALHFQQGKGEPLRGNGSVSIADLLVNGADSADRLLSWQQLDAQGLEFALGARTLSVKDVIVEAPGAKIVIAQDRSVNLAQVLTTPEVSAPPAVGASPKQPPPASDNASPVDFRIGQVRLRNGIVDYADLSLVLPFSTQVTGLQGVIASITNDPARRADVKASGSIQPYGSASVEGSLVPFNPSQFTDLQVVFNNVPMPPLSPYTATFAGRKVESGRLWLDVDYQVEDGELLGSNDIRLADFTLGERVEAPDAMDLPLNLAVALLTDSKGEIKLSVPVRGELGDPQFSVASAVKQVLGNLLKRVVTAPFRALANLFGGDADALASIGFRPGSAELTPEQREKLDALTRALQERPQLQLVVSAPHDPQADAAMLKRNLARRELAAALGRQPSNTEDSEPIAYDDPATRRALERLLQERVGAAALSQLRAEMGGGGGSGSRAIYRDMFDRIAASQPLRDTATQVLATQRARTVAQYLQQHGVDAARVQTGRIAEVRAGDQGSVTAQLQIAAMGDSG